MHEGMAPPGNVEWERFAVSGVEDFHDAVRGAGLDAVQLSKGPLAGSLAFCTDNGITFTSGRIGGKVRLTGPLSETLVTLGVGVNLAPGSRHWMREVETGGVGVFMAGDEHDAVYTPGTIYAAATLSPDRLEERAAQMGKILDARQLGRTGISDRRVTNRVTSELQNAFRLIHRGSVSSVAIGGYMLDAIITVLAREPRAIPPHDDRAGHGRIVAKGLDYIHHNLAEPLHISGIARAALTSQSTLYRAFHCVLGETPQSYARKLRLNRIRRDLATPAEARCTITILANKWGISELGRLSGCYRETFGELPSRTRTKLVEAMDIKSRNLRMSA